VLIEQVTAVPVRVPLRSPLVTALGAARFSEYGIVRLRTDDGREGLGEISMIWHGNGVGLCRDVVDRIGPAVTGLPVLSRTAVMQRASRELQFGRHSLAALAALDMALLDLAGQELGQPVLNLLGGKVRDSVELSMSLSIAETADVVLEAKQYVDQGFRALKVKGDRDIDRLVQTVQALRSEFGPELKLRIDFNMACHQAKEALSILRRLEPYDVISAEQPLSADDFEGARFLTATSPIPVMLDESVWTARDALRAIRMRAADLVNIYVSEAGGLSEAMGIAQLCETAGLGIAIGSMPELGIGTSAAAHVAFAVPKLEHPSDVAGFAYHADDVVTHDLRIVDGRLLPPTAPGLGVRIDEEKLAHYRWEV
jgi:L-alanine-DL-glutamate epimerase-like enolase superfamily enzyme